MYQRVNTCIHHACMHHLTFHPKVDFFLFVCLFVVGFFLTKSVTFTHLILYKSLKRKGLVDLLNDDDDCCPKNCFVRVYEHIISLYRE